MKKVYLYVILPFAGTLLLALFGWGYLEMSDVVQCVCRILVWILLAITITATVVILRSEIMNRIVSLTPVVMIKFKEREKWKRMKRDPLSFIFPYLQTVSASPTELENNYLSVTFCYPSRVLKNSFDQPPDPFPGQEGGKDCIWGTPPDP